MTLQNIESAQDFDSSIRLLFRLETVRQFMHFPAVIFIKLFRQNIMLHSKDGLKAKIGDSDVVDFMMMTDFRCWWQNHFVDDFFRYVSDFLNVFNVFNLNRLPTPQTSHQYIWSPTFVTNIYVTFKIRNRLLIIRR